MASFGIDEWMELERSARLTDSAFGEMDLDADLYLGLMRQVGRRQRPPLVFWASCWQEARAKMWTDKK
jgi:hypothetical protein